MREALLCERETTKSNKSVRPVLGVDFEAGPCMLGTCEDCGDLKKLPLCDAELEVLRHVVYMSKENVEYVKNNGDVGSRHHPPSLLLLPPVLPPPSLYYHHHGIDIQSGLLLFGWFVLISSNFVSPQLFFRPHFSFIRNAGPFDFLRPPLTALFLFPLS